MPVPALDIDVDLGVRPAASDGVPAHRVAVARLTLGGRRADALILKLQRADTPELLRRIRGTTSLTMARSEGVVLVRAWRHDEDLGVLTTIPEPRGSVKALGLSMGGAHPPHWWQHELLVVLPVSVHVAQDNGNVPAGWPDPPACLHRRAQAPAP